MGPSGQVVYFLHLAGWFGPKLTPHAWCRAIALVLKILRCRLSFPYGCHMDDLFLVLPDLGEDV
eukprot:1755683-Lingulodinium_polyedra.AAC.1